MPFEQKSSGVSPAPLPGEIPMAMTELPSEKPPGGPSAKAPQDAADLEKKLARLLAETSEELEHIDSFDDEQRSELYTILQALREDNLAHQAFLGNWISDRPAKAGNEATGDRKDA
jgi:hypothetical protein